MDVKTVHVSDIPNLDQRPENATFSLSSSSNTSRVGAIRIREEGAYKCKFPKFVVMGHRGHGMNMLQSSDPRLKYLKENSILSFNAAANFPIDFIEFDVQVTRDDCPVIFHDNCILTQEKGVIIDTRVTNLTLAEFLCFGPQKKEHGKVGEPLFRKTKDEKILPWIVENDDSLCTLQEAFDKVEQSIGFNIEIKFDDDIFYKHERLNHILQVILQVVNEYAKNRPVTFSSFHPDAAVLMRKLQDRYPVFFLRKGGSELHVDIRRNSIEEAIKLCLGVGLQEIVCEVKAILRNLDAIPKIKDSNLQLFTYGQLNNVAEIVRLQHWMGVNGVIVNLVQEITEALVGCSSETKNNGLVLI